jgi:UDP-N-acetylmuramyl pentapeptide phosphotransferase/UDP-N-acetylglucosamine-1-phosphate transferase
MNLALSLSVFALSAATIAFALRSGLAWKIAVDTPNARSLHERPTPRAGGLLFLPWVLAAAWVSGAGGRLVWLALLLAAVSLVDDRKGLPIAWRFVAHLVAAAVVVADYGLLAGVGAALAIAWMTNLYNFMDGADGLAGGMAVLGFGAFTVASLAAGQTELANLCLLVTAGAAGFLLFNFPPARLFMGDAGSIPLGFLAGAVGAEGWRLEVWPWWFPLLVFSPFVTDATVTLLRRLLRGDRFWQPHREHAYQKLVRSGWSHRSLAFAELSLMAVCATSALMLLGRSAMVAMAALSIFAALYLVIMLWVDRRWDRS